MRSRNACTPPACSARSTAGSGLHFTAYMHAAGERGDEAARRCGDRRRAQAVHRLFRALGGDQAIDRGQAQHGGNAAKRRRSGETAVRTRRLVIAAILASTSGRADGAPGGSGQNGGDNRRHAPCAAATGTQPMLRGLRIAANRSANIGGSLTTPAHGWPARPKRTRLRRCCAPGFRRGLAARAMRQAPPRPARGRSGERAYRGDRPGECYAFLECDGSIRSAHG